MQFSNQKHVHISLNRKGRWDTADDFATSFFYFYLFSTALRDLANSRFVHSLMLFSHFFFFFFLVCPDFLPLSLCLANGFGHKWWKGDMFIPLQFATFYYRQVIFLWSDCQLRAWHSLPRWKHGLCMRRVLSCGSTSFPWFVFFFVALQWGSTIHKHTGRWITAEILDLCDKRRELRKKRFEPEGAAKYKEVNNSIKWYMKKAKENWIGEQCSETEENLRKNNGKMAYQLVKDLTTVKQGKATTVQDRSGKCLTE